MLDRQKRTMRQSIILSLLFIVLMTNVSYGGTGGFLTFSPQTKPSASVATKTWPLFFARLRAAVRKRDHSALKEMMPPGFTYDCCVNEDKNGDGETRDEAFQQWDSSTTEGWGALNKLLSQGVVPASAQWTRQNGRSKPNFIAPPSANRTSYNGPIADFEFRHDRWYFVSFQFNEGDDASGAPPPNNVTAPLNLEKYIDRDLSDLLREVPRVGNRLNVLLGSNYRLFMKNLTVSATLVNRQGFLMMHGLAPHMGTVEEAVFLISLSSQKMHCAILSRRFGGKHKVFSEDPDNIPTALINSAFYR